LFATISEVNLRRSRRHRLHAFRKTGAVGAALVVLVTGACGASLRSEPSENVRPPAIGTPAGPSDVSGIYRSVRNALLQLRDNGDLFLVVPDGTGASSGKFTLQQGRVELQTSNCGDAVGRYGLVVTGEQEAGKAMLQFTGYDDACADRLRHLTIDPWVYANS
jgi:hypothetical protein